MDTDRGKSDDNRRKIGLVKAAVNMYGDKIFNGKPASIKNSQSILSAEPNLNTREIHFARRDINRYNQSKHDAGTVTAKAELELIDAKKIVKELTSALEDSDLKAKAQRLDLDKLKRQVSHDKEGKSESYEYVQVMQELEFIKQELSKLKLDMASVLDEKARAVKESEASSSKMISDSNSAKALENEIEEVNEEHVLVELARIEAQKEFRAIETQKMKHANEVKSHIEHTRKMVNVIMQEIDHSKELEKKLADTMSDIDVLQNELNQFKEMDAMVFQSSSSSLTDSKETPNGVLLQSVTSEELEGAKEALAKVKAEGFQFMSSMDIVRQELRHVIEETSKLQENEQKTNLMLHNLNSKLLLAKARLESVSVAEEKTNGVVTNLTLTLQQLQLETVAAKKEKELIDEETRSIKVEIQKTENEIDLTEERLQAAMKEIETVKLSETMTLDKLKILTDITMRARASASQHNATIIVSRFEYEYLTGRARGAEEIADKKVVAAQAWIEALKASEKEILMRTELAQRELLELGLEVQNRADKLLPAKKVAEVEELQSLKLTGAAQPRKSMKDTTPARRARSRRPGSPVIRYMPRSTSATKRNKKKVIPDISKFFSKEKAIQRM